MRHNVLTLTGAAALLALTACSTERSSTGPRDDQALSRTDALELATLIVDDLGIDSASIAMRTARSTPVVGLKAVGRNAAMPAVRNTPETETIACPEGGQVTATLAMAPDSLSFTVALVYRACAVRSPRGRVWTITSSPALTVRVGYNIDFDRETITSDVSLRGAFQYKSGGLAGSCSSDAGMRWRSTFSDPPFVTTVGSGTFCGQRIDDVFR
jgi:hypothetical protein